MTARVEVQLTGGNGHPLQDTGVLVQVQPVDNGTPQQAYTDALGQANFTVRSGDRFKLTVSGPAIETKSSLFDVPFAERLHTEYVEVKLVQGGTTMKSPEGMVSASALHVPEKAEHEFEKGLQQMRSRNWDKAREHFEKAIKEYPQFDWAYNNMGVADIQEKKSDAARKAFEKAVALNDKNPDAARNLARMEIAEGDFGRAKELLLKALGVDPRSPDSLTLLAYAQLRTHDFDAALSNALHAHQGEPDRFPLAHLIAARIYELRGAQASAKTQYQMYLKEAPDTPEARLAEEGVQRLAGAH
jgi:Tfp pilus assembly protein PilF